MHCGKHPTGKKPLVVYVVNAFVLVILLFFFALKAVINIFVFMLVTKM